MKLRTKDNSLILEGNLDERVDAAALVQALREAANQGARVAIDMSGLSHGNSTGIWHWLRAIKDAGSPRISYVNCPPWLVDQMNVLRDFFVGDVEVDSIQVPYYDDEMDAIVIKVMRPGTEIPQRTSYADYNFPPCEVDGRVCEVAVDPEIYLAFLSRLRSA